MPGIAAATRASLDPSLARSYAEELAIRLTLRDKFAEKLKQGGPKDIRYSRTNDENEQRIAVLERLVSIDQNAAGRLAELQSALDDCEGKRAAAIARLAAERDRFQAMNAELQAQVQAREENLRKLAEWRSRLPSESSQIPAQIERTSEKLAALRAQYEMQVVELTRARDESLARNLEIQAETDRSHAALVEARARSEALDRQIEELTRDAERAAAQIDREKTQIADLSARFQQSQQELASVSSLHASELAELQQLRAKLGSLEPVVPALQQQLGACSAFAQTAQAKLAEQDNRLKSLTVAKDEIDRRVAEADARVLQIGAERDSLNQQISALTALQQTTETNLAAVSAALEGARQDRSKEAAALIAEKQALDVQLERATSAQTAAEEKSRQLAAQSAVVAAEGEAQKAESQRVAERIEEAENDRSAARAELDGRNSELAAVRAELDKKESERARLASSVSDLETQLNSITTAKEAEEVARRKLEDRSERQQKRQTELEVVIEEHKRRLLETAKQLESAKKEAGEMQENIRRLQSEKDDCGARTADLDTRLAKQQEKATNEQMEHLNKISVMEEQIKKFQGEKRDLQSQLDECKASRESGAIEAVQVETQRALGEAKLLAAETQNAAASDRIASLERLIREKGVEIESAAADLESRRAEASRVEREMADRTVELENKVAAMENEGLEEKRRFEEEKNLAIGKLGLSEEEKRNLEERIAELSGQLAETKESVKAKLAEKDAAIAVMRLEAEALRAESEKQNAVVRQSVEETRKRLEEVERAKAAEEEKHRADLARLASASRSESEATLAKLRKSETERAHLVEVITRLRAEAEAAGVEIQDEPRSLSLPPDEVEISRFVAPAVEQERAIYDLAAQIAELRKGLASAVELYRALTQSAAKAMERVDVYGAKESPASYFTACLIMHEAWKTLFRVPVSLRVAETDDLKFRVDVPEAVIRDLKNRLPKNMPLSAPMRVDVLFHRLAAATDRIEDRQENEPLLKYVREMIKYSAENLGRKIDAVRSMNAAKADSIRRNHRPSPILSFVRLNAAEPSEPSVRYAIELLEKNTVMRVRYDDQPVALYDKKGSEWVRNGVPSRYASEYYLGPVTQAFPPAVTNSRIAGDDSFRLSAELPLRNGQPVCFLLVGTSGSGKTTTMIKADYTTSDSSGKAVRVQEPGIMLHLLSNLAKEYRAGDKTYGAYTSCSVAVYEYEAGKKDDAVCRKFPGEAFTVLRVRPGKKEEVKYDSCASTTTLKYENRGGVWRNDAAALDDELVGYIDGRRNVASTPFNPVSSRSHVVVIIKLAGAGETHLVLCDLAGDEVEFNCSDQAQLDAIAGKDSDLVQAEEIARLGELKDLAGYLDVSAPVVSQEELERLDRFVNVIAEAFNSVTLSGAGPVPLPDSVRSKYLEWIKKDKSLKDKSLKFDVSKIAKYDDVTFDVNARNAFKGKVTDKSPVVQFATILNKTKDEEWKLLEKLYASLVEPFRLGVQIPEMVRVVVWYLTAFPEKRNALLRHSRLTTALTNKKQLEPKDTITTLLQKEICMKRVGEGKYINRTLDDLRRWIAGRAERDGYAPFDDHCAPVQCSAGFCFGKSDYYDPIVEPVRSSFGEVVQRIMSVPGSDKMVLALFLVFNLSKRADNPPPRPFIDINDMLVELERRRPLFPFDEPDADNASVQRLLVNPLLDSLPPSIAKTLREIAGEVLAGQKRLDVLIQAVEEWNSTTALRSLLFLDSVVKGARPMPACRV